MLHVRFRTALFFCVFGALAPHVQAQSTFGTILGTLTDPSGQVVSSARVQLSNKGTNASRPTHNWSTRIAFLHGWLAQRNCSVLQDCMDVRMALRYFCDLCFTIGSLTVAQLVGFAFCNCETQQIAFDIDGRNLLAARRFEALENIRQSFAASSSLLGLDFCSTAEQDREIRTDSKGYSFSLLG